MANKGNGYCDSVWWMQREEAESDTQKPEPQTQPQTNNQQKTSEN